MFSDMQGGSRPAQSMQMHRSKLRNYKTIYKVYCSQRKYIVAISKSTVSVYLLVAIRTIHFGVLGVKLLN